MKLAVLLLTTSTRPCTTTKYDQECITIDYTLARRAPIRFPVVLVRIESTSPPIDDSRRFRSCYDPIRYVEGYCVVLATRRNPRGRDRESPPPSLSAHSHRHHSLKTLLLFAHSVRGQARLHLYYKDNLDYYQSY